MRLYANNAHSVLIEATDEVTTVIQVRPDDAARFPVPEEASDEFFTLTLWDGLQFEIVECFHNYLDGYLLVRRGMEGTSPLVFADGTAVRHGITAGDLANIPQMEVIQPLIDGKAAVDHEHEVADLSDVDIEEQAVRPHGSMLSWSNGKWRLVAGIISDLVSNASSVAGDTVTEALEQLLNDATALAASLKALAFKDVVASGDFASSAYDDITSAIIDRICPAGAITDYGGSTEPAGWLFCNGQGVTTAFPTLRNRLIAAGSPYGTTGGGHPRVPDIRGRVTAAPNNMGGTTSVGLLTNVGTGNPGINGDAIGSTGGVDRHTLTLGQMPEHNHPASSGNAGLHAHNYVFRDTTTELASGAFENIWQGSDTTTTSVEGEHNHPITVNNTGSSQAHPNAQPTIILNKIIKAH